MASIAIDDAVGGYAWRDMSGKSGSCAAGGDRAASVRNLGASLLDNGINGNEIVTANGAGKYQSLLPAHPALSAKALAVWDGKCQRCGDTGTVSVATQPHVRDANGNVGPSYETVACGCGA